MQLFFFWRLFSPAERRVAKFKRLTQQSDLFDPVWYRDRYADVSASDLEPLDHFCRYGDRELRSPGPDFDSAAYVLSNPDLATDQIGPFEHYLGTANQRVSQRIGAAEPTPRDFLETIRQSGLFDDAWYRERYADIRSPEIDALSHFAFFGAKEGRDPGPNFSSLLYQIIHADRIEPGETPFEHFVKKGRSAGIEPPSTRSYGVWRDFFASVGEQDFRLMRSHAEMAGFGGLLVVWIFDAWACANAVEIIGSLKQQALGDWRAIVVFADDASDTDRARVEALVSDDARIQCGSVAQLGTRDNERGVLVVHGATLLAPHAGYLLLERARATSADFVYADHDRWTADGDRADPTMTPEFSPALLQSNFYIGPATLISASLSRDALMAIVSELRQRRVDRLSAAILATPRNRIARVPFVLSSLHSEAPPLEAKGVAPRAERERVRVSIVIPTRDKVDLLRACIDSIERKSAYPRDMIEIIVVNNGSVTDAAKRYFAELKLRSGFEIVAAPGDFNFARLNNLGARAASGEVLILLNNDTIVIAPDWIDRLVEQCMQEDVGAVGCKLLYPDDTIQHAGCVLGVAGLAAHRHVGKTPEKVADGDATREITAVTGACLAARKVVYDRIGGLDETLRIAFNDVKFCIDCLDLGLRNVYIADPLLYHLESKTRGFDLTSNQIALRNREAIYTRRRATAYFQNDPFYSPNLSVTTIDDLAFPPRRRKPWLVAAPDRPRRIMLLSVTHSIGSGVAVVLNQQAQALLRKGFEVIVAGPRSEDDFEYAGCHRVIANTPLVAAIAAVRRDVDCVVVHTPPFYSIVRYFGAWPLVYYIDHGEPNPEFFEDRDARVDVNWEKRFCAPMAKRVFAVSRAIRDQSLDDRTVVARNGNSHLAAWSDGWRERRRVGREKLGWTDKFVVLTICRFGAAERRYKGVDTFVEISKELWFAHPSTAGKVVFALAGKGGEDDVKQMEQEGLVVFPNIADSVMETLLASADLYMSFSKWEGYNLGIGQALAMGLPVIASDIEAHREFPIFTTNDVRVAMGKLCETFEAAQDGAEAKRQAFVESWDAWNDTVIGALKADFEET